MKHKSKVKGKQRNSAVTDVIGTLLMLMIAIGLFSVLYYFVFSIDAPNQDPSVSIIAYTDGENIILEHWGGESLDGTTKVSLSVAGTDYGPYNLSDEEKWEFGMKSIFDLNLPLLNNQVSYRVMNSNLNRELTRGVIQEGYTSRVGNSPPHNAILISPADGGNIPSISDPILKVRVFDPDGDFMNVHFHNASDGNLIGVDNNIPDGATASFVWSDLIASYPYSWYVNVTDDGQNFVQSDTWSFTLIDYEPPTITITNPNGGESWNAGSTYDITWSTTPGDGSIENVDLKYSTDGGVTYTDIDSGTTDDGTYSWTVPDDPGTQCFIHGIVHDEYGLYDQDESDSNFTIIGIPPVPPSNLVVEHYGSVSLVEDISNSVTLSQGSQVNNYEFTHNQDDSYHQITEVKLPPPDKTSLDVIYTFPISGDSNPYTLKLDAFRVDEEVYEVSYQVNGGGYSKIAEINADSDTDTYLNFVLSGILEGAIVDIRISDTQADNNEQIGILYVDHIYIESYDSGSNTDNRLTWDASSDDGLGLDDVSIYNIYRSSDGSSWSEVGQVPADDSISYSFIDVGKGTSDATRWWYMVRAEDSSGLESVNSNSAQEPIT